MEHFWVALDKLWKKLASLKFTMLLFILMILLSIPGMLFLQRNVSNVDPGNQYDYEFWKIAESLQLFTSYHSFWYVGLIIFLALNMIACSMERYPAMWKMAIMKPRLLEPENLKKTETSFLYEATTNLTKEEFQNAYYEEKKLQFWGCQLLKKDDRILLFWQKHRWTRIANFLVHFSLLFVFLGAIISALFGFEGAMSIVEGRAVDTVLIFKEGPYSGLKPVPARYNALPTERTLPFRVEAQDFNVEFYEKFPGRPKTFETKLNIIDRERKKRIGSASLFVNQPYSHDGIYFYQSSYSSQGDFKVSLRLVDKDNPYDQSFFRTQLGKIESIPKVKEKLVVLNAQMNFQGLGPAAQVQIVENEQGVGEPFWVLKNRQELDFQRSRSWGIILDDLEEKYITGLQVARDPGAPVYWFGCVGMLIGTFYALFYQHKKFYLIYKNKKIYFYASTHRLPFRFEKEAKGEWQEILNKIGRNPV